MRPAKELLVSVDDPSAVQVVRRELDLDPVPRKDSDPVAPHLAGGVAEGLVPAVERDPEIAVSQRLDHLAVELDLLFLLGNGSLLTGWARRRRNSSFQP